MAVRKLELAETPPALSEEEMYIAVQRCLLEAGLIREIKPPITDHTPWANRKPIESKGRPLSEILIEERR